MQKSLTEIAKLIDGEVVGDGKTLITGVSGILDAKKGELTFLANTKYLSHLKSTEASAVIVSRGQEIAGIPFIRVDNPSFSFSEILSMFTEEERDEFKGIHSTAVIGENVTIGENVSIGPYSVVESNVSIAKGTLISGQCYIGYGSKIGSQCKLYPQVSIREKTKIGNNVIIHNGSVIGSDGFGYEFIDGVHHKIPQVGTVLIEDNVEIGSNVSIDRARFDKTVIGKGSKIDNLVQIAHNVIIGENCIIVAQVGISGSSVIGKGSILAGQAGVAGHLTIGEGSIIASQSGVTKSLPANSKVSGYPARPHVEVLKIDASAKKLPKYIKMIKELEKRVNDIEAKNDQ